MEASHRAFVTPRYVLKVAVAACWFRSPFVCVRVLFEKRMCTLEKANVHP